LRQERHCSEESRWAAIGLEQEWGEYWGRGAGISLG
jgi:hypothetical protein